MGKLDWKQISASKGYCSLKAAYVRDVQRSNMRNLKGLHPMRDKAEFRRHFKKAIGLAMKYSNLWSISIEEVLNYWESIRKVWWLNFYQSCVLSRHKPASVR